MSAITGIYHTDNQPLSADHNKLLMNGLNKFPANLSDSWEDEDVFLGCHAQWITPESLNEKLPYVDYERQMVITADAIIDNREEVLNKLQIDKVDGLALPDSRLILLAYSRWGEKVVEILVGEFAFVIWDKKNKKLFGARDFSGSRTLYFYKNKQKFAFCTTMESLLKLPYVKNAINESWFAEYLAIPGMNEVVDTSLTPFKDIEQLPPSHSFIVSNGELSISRYCWLTNQPMLKLKTNQEYEEAFRDVFKEAVSTKLRTHREVGGHLSGGLDSGAVVSFAAKELRNEKKTLHTFSYIPPKDFEDWTPRNRLANEEPYIKSTVNYVGNIKDHYLDFNDVDPIEEISDWIEMMEMPYKFFANSNWIKGIYKAANNHNIGVLLNGGRGNLSISWGSALNYYATLLKKFKWFQLYNELNCYSENMGGNRFRLLPTLGKIAFPKFNKEIPHKFPQIVNQDLAKKTGVYEKLEHYGVKIESSSFGNDLYEARKRHFEEVFSWNATGTLGTKLSLKYSLWKRDPTNDIRVIRFCLSLPEEQYVQNGMDRALIRRSTRNYLPDYVRLNQKIRGAQGVDYIHRLAPDWKRFMSIVQKLAHDEVLSNLIDMDVLKKAITKIEKDPKPEYSLDPDFWIIIRSLIIHQFIKSLA